MKRVNSIFTEELRNKQNRYFSESIKKEIVRGIEKNLHSVSEVCNVHQVSRTSVYRWIYKYSSMAKKQHKQVIEPKSDTKKIAALEARIKELEQAVGQKQMLLDFNEKMIEIAEKRFNIEIKKKSDSKPLSGTGKTKGSTPTS